MKLPGSFGSGNYIAGKNTARFVRQRKYKEKKKKKKSAGKVSFNGLPICPL